MAFRYDFLISALRLRVEAPGRLQIPEAFRPFQTDVLPVCEPDVLVEIRFETPSGTDRRQLSERYRWRNGAYIVRQEPAGRGEPCRLFLPPEFAATFCRCGNWLLYLALERLLLPFGRLLLHASAVVYRGMAYVFAAPSGAGKSTHAALWERFYGAELLNGDKVLLQGLPDGCRAYGSPVAGSSGIYRDLSAPVAAIVFLQKGTRNAVTCLSARQAVLSLYSEAVKSAWDRSFNSKLLELTEKLQKQTPVVSLSCLPEPGAVDCILRELEGIQA